MNKETFQKVKSVINFIKRHDMTLCGGFLRDYYFYKFKKASNPEAEFFFKDLDFYCYSKKDWDMIIKDLKMAFATEIERFHGGVEYYLCKARIELEEGSGDWVEIDLIFDKRIHNRDELMRSYEFDINQICYDREGVHFFNGFDSFEKSFKEKETSYNEFSINFNHPAKLIKRVEKLKNMGFKVSNPEVLSNHFLNMVGSVLK